MVASSLNKMWLSYLTASMMVTVAIAANGYLPPNQSPSKGYSYERPKIPFPEDNTPIAPVRTPPPPIRTPPPPVSTPGRPYVPPVTPTQGPYRPDHTDSHSHDDHHHDEHHHHHEPGMPFDFAYAVNEDGNDYSHKAKSDGDVTLGEYRIALPDGRTQIVKYTADWMNGFNAEVTYEGEAKYPDAAEYGANQRNRNIGRIPERGDNNGIAPGQSYLPADGGYQY